MSASPTPGGELPSGFGVCTSMPDVLFLPELIFGGLVWILVASTKVFYANPQGWVMFVSVFCFVFTFIWLFLFLLGANQSSFWPGLDVLYHGTAALFYLSASVAQAYATILINPATNSTTNPYTGPGFKEYQEDIAAVVFSYIATLLYVIHVVFSAIRWKKA
ncbi:mal, T cell differentiation protein b [Polypterus senegalus]|uniref:mal, T cell differentiation protein b n=1 Tax=Polypterus senegalus TaxID=55291 RepID=UPI0019625EC0|nr:mal, T cell differentiation protein b [Polypterus senegalus]